MVLFAVEQGQHSYRLGCDDVGKECIQGVGHESDKDEVAGEEKHCLDDRKGY